MKRNLDLVRELLLEIEKAPDYDGVDADALHIGDWTQKDIIYNLVLMHEAGLIDAVVHSSSEGPVAVWVKRMTWGGHEFLDAVREDAVWRKTKDAVGKVSKEAAFDVVKTVAVQVATALASSYLRP